MEASGHRNQTFAVTTRIYRAELPYLRLCLQQIAVLELEGAA